MADSDFTNQSYDQYIAPTPTGLPLSQTSSWLSPQNTIIPGSTPPTAQTLNSPLPSANQWMNALNAYVVPGADPSLGVLPSGEAINLTTGAPYTGTIDPTSQAFMKVAQGGQFPTFGTVLAGGGGKGTPLSGRGYMFTGTPTAQEIALQNAFLGGDLSAGPQLAQLRQARIQVNPLSGMKQIAAKYYGPGLMAIAGGLGGAGIGGLAGAGFGAGWGALTQGAQTKWKNPLAIGLGAAGGFGGGWAGGALGNSLGLNPFMTGALAGAGGSLGSSAGKALGGAPPSVGQLLTGAAIGAGAGGVGAGLGQMNPLLGKIGGTATGAILGATLPQEEPKKKLNPYAQGKKAL